jgi:nucleotide-binding universal stress UspA family protein
MIKDILVRLEDNDADGVKLTAATEIAQLFGGHITGLFLNILPAIAPEFGEPNPPTLALAREAGSAVEARLAIKLVELGMPAEIERFDVFSEEVAAVLNRECRVRDVFVSQAPNGDSELRSTLEELLFQSPRHLILIPKLGWTNSALKRIAVGWNETREAARAVGEALPYLYRAEAVTIVVVVDSMPVEEDAVIGRGLKRHLWHHGIRAVLHHQVRKQGTVAENIFQEAQRRDAGMIVIGGYHHGRLRERLLGGVTSSLFSHCPLPVLVAH